MIDEKHLSRGSIRTKIALGVGAVALMMWIVLAGFGFRAGNLMLDMASERMFAAATNSIGVELQDAYQPVAWATTLLADSRLMQETEALPRLTYLARLTAILADLPTAAAIQVGDDTGDYFIVRDLASAALAKKLDAPPGTRFAADHINGGQGDHVRWFYDETLQLLLRRELPESNYDPRSRPWYIEAMANEGTITTRPYVFFFMEEIGITTGHANPEKTAVIAIDIELSSLSGVLADQRITHSSLAVLDADGGVVAWSENEPVVVQGEDNALRRMRVDELQRAEVQAFFKQGTIDGWLTHSAVLPMSDNIAPRLTILVPEGELVAQLEAVQQQTLLVSLLMLLVVIPLTWLLAKRVASPLRELHQAIEKVGEGDFQFWLPEITSRDEVGDLNLALRTMRTSLAQYIKDLEAETSARERLEGELGVARKIQMSLVPGAGELSRSIGEDSLFARLIPAKAVGGDLYDVIELDDGSFFLAVGDVSDKGIPAALFMSRTVTLAKMLVPRTESLAELLVALNEELVEGNDECMFITLFCGIYDASSGQLRFACAGHNPPVLKSASGTALIEMNAGSPLGIFPGMEYVEELMTLQAGDSLVMYSDGITEAFNEAREEFTDERLVSLVAGLPASLDTTESGTQILDAVTQFASAAPQSDDITLMILDRMS